jgi:amino acid adenylation domain-containing protein
MTAIRESAPLYAANATSIPLVFAKQASLRPHAIAVSCDHARLTYAALDSKSTVLARRLLDAGIGPGDRVGVCLESSIELVTALLAVMKCGAAYVPLPPEYPAARISFIAEDTDLAVLITDLDVLRGFSGLRVQPDEATENDDIRLPEVNPGSIAYVIYTSGSTGRPKGVLIPHRNVIALMRATADEFCLSSSDVWSVFHSFAFDFSVWEIWGALLTGGQIVMVNRWTARDPDDFLSLLAATKVTVLSQTPSAFSQLLPAAMAAMRQLAVRLLVFGGEVLDTRMLAGWFARYPQCRVENMYGITETTVHSTRRTLTPADAESGCRSVGRALPGWEVHVMDHDGNPSPAGETGEIYVAGAGLAQGYLGLPELTAQRFVLDRDAGAASRRMYRTGDRGRVDENGELECLGRIDDQVKVRGHRIELGEIRAVLQTAPAVRAAAVIARQNAEAGGARIDAYVVARNDPGLQAGLRDLLAARLPDYMFPASIVRVDELPLTPNGKLDVQLLPVPATADSRGPASGDQVSGAYSAELARLWSDLLGAWPSPQDSFFEIGGNSLLIAELKTRIQQSGLAFPTLKDLYLHSTFAAMSELIRSYQRVT